MDEFASLLPTYVIMTHDVLITTGNLIVMSHLEMCGLIPLRFKQ